MKSSKPLRSRYATALGRALDAQLEERAIRANDLAQRLGVSPSYVSRVMNGRVKASASVIDRFSTALNLSQVDASSLMAAAATTSGYKIEVCPHCGKSLHEKS